MIERVDADLLAFDHAPVGIVLTERRMIQSCNQTFAEIFGYEKSELLGRSFRMLYTSRKEFDDIRDVGLEPLRNTGIYSDERVITRKDGAKIWCHFRAHTLTPEEPLERTILSFARIADKPSDVSLTPRERQVVSHLSKGLTSKEIARLADLSPRTIEDVRSRLLKKFKVKNTTELLTHLTRIE